MSDRGFFSSGFLLTQFHSLLDLLSGDTDNHTIVAHINLVMSVRRLFFFSFSQIVKSI